MVKCEGPTQRQDNELHCLNCGKWEQRLEEVEKDREEMNSNDWRERLNEAYENKS